MVLEVVIAVVIAVVGIIVGFIDRKRKKLRITESLQIPLKRPMHPENGDVWIE